MIDLNLERCFMPEPLNDGKEVVKQRAITEEEEVERIAQALERARQEVKPIVKREMEAEVITDELLNLRLKKKN
jgi:F420-0:gamma-glutamyl ligase-like protein